MQFDIAVPTVLDCFENYFTMFSEKFSDLKEHREAIKTEAINLMTVAMLNFRFTYEMKPSQLTLVIIKMAVNSVEAKLRISLLTDLLSEEIKQHHEYSKGKMNGIEKRLKESQQSQC